ncbi:hypothetical protein [Streptomyces roseus]|uniref:Uncharacterized protein n=1 Tax=Streptomyces roseus TaxID=66430 RepID=A0A0J6XLS3_9ACTN|nr:hypothetical protein [Streptomyces roseus]KMO97045.1 hypothetical protein ACS04_14890 [Streptomyces roseus]
MTIHRPGRPADLPPAELLWARWAFVAVLEATTEAETHGVHRTGHWIDGGRLHLDDCGSTWWTLARVGQGRFVLYGEDESSQVKWHKPAIDMLAQAPDWLPHEKLRALLEGWELGCVYWYENGAWARAPYPEGLGDDGLDCGMDRFVERREVLGLLADHGPGAPQLLEDAEAYRLRPEALDALVAAGGDDHDRDEDWDLPAMHRALGMAGLTGETVTA